LRIHAVGNQEIGAQAQAGFLILMPILDVRQLGQDLMPRGVGNAMQVSVASARGSDRLAGGLRQTRMHGISHPRGIKSWPKLPDIQDWHQDQESSLAPGRQFPDSRRRGSATAEVTIQARGFFAPQWRQQLSVPIGGQ